MRPVSQLVSGQAYVITSRLNNNWVMTNNFKVAERDTSYFGPWLEHLQTAADNHIWYYVEETVDGVTGQYLRYGSLEDSSNYLSYTSRIGRLGTLSATNIYNTVTKVSDTVDAFYIRSTVDGSVVRGLNQHGGSGYDAAIPTSLYLNDSASSWVFNRIIPERTLSWTVDTNSLDIHSGKVGAVNYTVTLDGITQSEHEIVWTSSDETVASVSGDQIAAVGTGNATISATLKSVDGQMLNAPLTVDIPVSVSSHDWVDATCTAPKTCSICGLMEGGAIGHSWIDASCTLPKTCTTCGATEGESLGHQYQADTTLPTCTEGGYTVYTCSACGDNYVSDSIAATGHSYENGNCTLCGEKDPDYVAVVVPTLTLSYPTLSFEGAFSINYYFATANTPDAAPIFYYWDAATYNSVDELTIENATGTMDMVLDGDQWFGTVAGIAAKEIDQTYYTAGIYTVRETTYTSPVVSYSLGNYCETLAAQDNAFGAATAVYGYYAKAYFAS